MEIRRPHETIKIFSHERILNGTSLVIGEHGDTFAVLGKHVETVTRHPDDIIIKKPSKTI
ncbi:MAG: hypothetical protein V1811_00220 [Candidatus Micrarchaeota archaeon]